MSDTAIEKPTSRYSNFLAPIAAIASGILFALSLPPYDQGWLAWFAYAPLLFVAARFRPLEALGLGILSGLSTGITLAGIHGQSDKLFWAYAPALSFTVLVSAVTSVSSALRKRLSGALWAVTLSCAAVGFEWITTLMPIPVNAALSQYHWLNLIWIASLTGIWGVSFLIWLVNAAIADAIFSRKLTPILWISVGLIGVVLAFGTLKQAQTESSVGLIPVAAIQDYTGDETQGIETALDRGQWAGGDRDSMTKYAAQHGAKLVVWSEECLGSSFVPASRSDQACNLARHDNVSLVVGYQSTDQPLPYNCAAFIDPSGKVLGVYHKQHLYLGENRMIKAGHESPAFTTQIGKIGMEICFDSCYGDVTRKLVHNGARLIAMPNYDPPTPRGVLNNLHTSMIPFRAIENGVPFIRSDSNGRSMLVDSDGQIVALGPLYSAAIVQGLVHLGNGSTTLYTHLGDWFAYLCMLISAVLIFKSYKSKSAS